MQLIANGKKQFLFRTLLALAIIAVAAAVRIAPHPWNFTPVGAMALFSGAAVRNRRLAFLFPLLALFAGDAFIGIHKLMAVVYASFAVSVAIGLWIGERRSVTRIGLGTLLGATQFFLITNWGVWQFLTGFPHTAAGLLLCWNTLAGDAFYATLLFGGYALAERLLARRMQAEPGSTA